MFSRQLSEMQINNLNESELHILKYINFNQKSWDSVVSLN